ncbi:MAG: MMPL family transporter [Gammaproteobacteria bacterium]|nr:MMPL family transporter [Gammaproteobacteria bacterium]
MKNRLGSIIGRWVRMAVLYRWWVLLLACLLTALSLNYAISHLKISTDLANMLSPELSFRQTYEQYKRAFPQQVDTLVIVVDASAPELARQAASEIANRLEEQGERFNNVFVPGGGEFFERQALLYMDLPELEEQADKLAAIQPFLGRLTRDQSLYGLLTMLGDALDAVRDGEGLDLVPILTQLNEAVEWRLKGRDYPISWQELMFNEGAQGNHNRQFIVVQPRMEFSSLLAAKGAMESIRRLLEDSGLTQREGLRIRLTGTVALQYEELESVSRGAGIAAISALLMVLLVLTVGLRSLKLVIATLVSLLVGLVLTAGFATLAIGKLNLISVAFAVLYIGLGVDFAIHLCLRHRELIRAGNSTLAALVATGKGVGVSLVLCAITTAVGFYAFFPTAYSGVSELGLISGTGMFISLLVSLTLLPALLSIWPLRHAAADVVRQRGGPIAGWSDWPYRHAKALRWAALIAAVLALLVLPQLRFDYNPINLRNPDTESVATFRDLVENAATAPWNATVLAGNAAEVEIYQGLLNELDSVDKTVAVDDFVPENQMDKLTVIEDMALILGAELEGSQQPPPTSDQQLSSLRSFQFALETYAASSGNLPGRETVIKLRQNLQQFREQLAVKEIDKINTELNELQHSLLHYFPENMRMLKASLGATHFSMQDLPTDLVQRWVSQQGDFRIAVFPKSDISDNDALRRFVSEIRTEAPDATDDPVIILESAQVVVTAFQQAFTGAIIVIGLILILILRSIIDAVFVMIPLLFAGLLTVALFLLSGSVFNFANIIALPLLLGLGVDNGIHMVTRIRAADPNQRVNLLKTSTARAVLISALTTIVSFGNLIFSSHPGTAGMGKILTLGVLMTLLATLVVLPAMLARDQTVSAE